MSTSNITNIPSTQNCYIDGKEIKYTEGQTILEAASQADIYIPHLCYNKKFKPHGSCRVCIVNINGHSSCACTTPVTPNARIESDTVELNHDRRVLVQMLFTEGNHFCPSCEKSGDCLLQTTAYELGMVSPHFSPNFPIREVDASHVDMLIDHNRCIFCSLCVRASREIDCKNIFGLAQRGAKTTLSVNSPSGRLGDTDFSSSDYAANICPVGAILHKGTGFKNPIGQRSSDITPLKTHSTSGEDA